MNTGIPARSFAVPVAVVLSALVGTACAGPEVEPSEFSFLPSSLRAHTADNQVHGSIERLGAVSPAEGPDALVQVTAMALLFDGTMIAAAERATCDVRLYSTTLGSGVVRRFGRCGDGPGDFRHVRDMVSHGDTLYIYDAVLQTVVVTDPTGKEYRRIPLQSLVPGGFGQYHWAGFVGGGQEGLLVRTLAYNDAGERLPTATWADAPIVRVDLRRNTWTTLPSSPLSVPLLARKMADAPHGTSYPLSTCVVPDRSDWRVVVGNPYGFEYVVHNAAMQPTVAFTSEGLAPWHFVVDSTSPGGYAPGFSRHYQACSADLSVIAIRRYEGRDSRVEDQYGRMEVWTHTGDRIAAVEWGVGEGRSAHPQVGAPMGVLGDTIVTLFSDPLGAQVIELWRVRGGR